MRPLRADESRSIEDVSFVARCDESTQYYVIMKPRGFDAKQPHDLLIALHGHGSDRWQFVKNTRSECKSARDFADENRMLFVSPDYRAKTSWMGPEAEADLVQIIERLRNQFSIDRVFLCGGSMGGASALTFAAIHPELLDGVAAMNGTANHLEYNNFQDAISKSFGGTKAEIPEEYKTRSAEYWPERLTMPIGLTVGGQDRSVPPQSVIRLATVLKTIQPHVLLIHREQTGHTTNYEDGKAILKFIVSHAAQKIVSPKK